MGTSFLPIGGQTKTHKVEGAVVDHTGNPTGQKPPSGKASAGKLAVAFGELTGNCLWGWSWTWGILGAHRKLSLGLMLSSLAVHLMTELHWDKERGHTPSPAVCPLLTTLNPELAVRGGQSRGSSAGSQAVPLRVDLERRSNTLITGTGTKCSWLWIWVKGYVWEFFLLFLNSSVCLKLLLN